MAGECVDANPGELRQPVDAVVQTPQFKDLGMGVDADAQRTVCAPGGRHARTETHHGSCAIAGGTGSDGIGSDSPDQDCNDRTDTVPARSASMPWTAAASPATVVIHPMPSAMAAVRISYAAARMQKACDVAFGV